MAFHGKGAVSKLIPIKNAPLVDKVIDFVTLPSKALGNLTAPCTAR